MRGRLLAVLFALALPVPAPAADDEAPMSIVGEDERAALQRQLRTPLPANASPEQLRRHYGARADAARRLGDVVERERVLRQAMAALPDDPRWPNDLAWMQHDAGRTADALRLWEAAIGLARDPPDRLLYESNRLLVLASRGDPELPAQLARLRKEAEAELAARNAPADRVRVLRVLGRLAEREAGWHERRLQLADALAARAEAERRYREAFDGLDAAGVRRGSLGGYTAASLALSQRDRAGTLVLMGRYPEAEALLDEHLRFLQTQELPGDYVAGAHRALAELRFARGEFAEAERQLRLSRAARDRMRFARHHPSQAAVTRTLVLVLWARGEVDAARRELDDHDERLRRAKQPTDASRMLWERGLVDLSSGRSAEAASQFERLATARRRTLGPGHYHAAVAMGLQGVALWRQGERERGGDLLKDAVLDMLSPRNADFLDDAYVRRPVRTLVFTTYLDAMAARGGLQAIAAIGVADQLLAGTTAQAMADAALRSLSADPALAELVRQEQDLRHQLQSLQAPAMGDDAATTAPDEAMRRRIADLELQRQQLQERLRARVPGYDRLLRPPLPNPTEVAQRLRRDEAMLLAMPTERALYLWLIVPDELPQFARVDVGAAALHALEQRLRQGVDFERNGGRAGRFDHAAAQELYRHVLAPVAPRLKGRRHLIVATAGPLARLPFAFMLTGPTTAEPRPWLVRQLAISQVPNIAAWLALRQLPPAQTAAEPLVAWADPSFGRRSPRPPQAPGRRDAGGGAASAAEGADRAASGRAAAAVELPPLPETRDEVRAIAAALKADPGRDLILGAQATRDSVLALNRSGQLARKRVLVFATHGLMAGDLPGLTQPALAMAAAGRGAGVAASVIGLDDVLGLKLNAEWVVLSACNTAAGDGRGEEALSGLARGFLYAGSRSLLVTHWAVETESAKRLTTATFEHHAAQRDASKAESLRQAMLAVMAMPRWDHPAYWAPYVLVGDGGR